MIVQWRPFHFAFCATSWLTVSMMFCTSSNSMKCSNLSQPFSFRTKKNLKHGLNVFVVKAAQGKLCSWFHLGKQFEVWDSIWKYRVVGPSLTPRICAKHFLSFPQKTSPQRKLRQTKSLFSIFYTYSWALVHWLRPSFALKWKLKPFTILF